MEEIEFNKETEKILTELYHKIGLRKSVIRGVLDDYPLVCRTIYKFGKEQTIKDVLKLIKAWNGYGDERFPEGEVKELVREIKKLKWKTQQQ